MGQEKLRMSVKFILRQDFFSDAFHKFGQIFTSEKEGVLNSLIMEQLFDELKNPEPVRLNNRNGFGYVVDFLV